MSEYYVENDEGKLEISIYYGLKKASFLTSKDSR